MLRSAKGAEGEIWQEESGTAWFASVDAAKAGPVRTPKLRRTVAQ
jgi:hypothetical protein